MNLHNYKKANFREVEQWIIKDFKLSDYQKQLLQNNETIRFAPFEFFQKRKYVKKLHNALIVESNEIYSLEYVKETHLNPEDFQYAVYPDSERMDLGQNKLSAIFRYKDHAETFGKNMWGKFYIIEPIICDKFDK